MGPFEQAWTFIKSNYDIDFSDLGPEGFPSQYKFHPDSAAYNKNYAQNRQMYQLDPDTNQRWMEESYVPDVTSMLELAALRQATGQQVPIDLLKPPEPEPGFDDDDMRYGRGITSKEPMHNLPKSRKDNPLGE